jgi:hypothetical protein
MDRLLPRAGQAIDKAPRGRRVGAGGVPKLVPGQNSGPIGNDGRITDDAERLAIGDALRKPSVSLMTAWRSRSGTSASMHKVV